MTHKPLTGKKIAVLVESEYIPEEINYYKIGFAVLGAEVHFLAHLWGNDKLTIVSDVTSREQNLEWMDVNMEVANADANDYDAVIMAANYCSVRLREIPPMHSLGNCQETRTAPAVRFYAEAMRNKKIVKGAMCHGLWILTPVPKLLKGRKVICHTVVLSDICNAGATFVPDPNEVVVDGDLVTARSAKNLAAYFDAIVKGVIRNNQYIPTQTGIDATFVFLAAIEANNLHSVADLIKQGINVNKRGPTNLTPLMIAAGRGYVQMTQMLLDACADVHVVDSVTGASALHKAAQGGYVDVARILLDHGAFLNLQSAVVGHTPLIDAVWSKQPAMAKFLLDRGAIIDIKGHHGADVLEFVSDNPTWTAGFTAPGQETWGKEIQDMLQARKNTDGEAQKQLLMQAVMAGDLETVQALIAKGVNVDEASPIVGGGNDGQNPLLVACFTGRTEITRELLNAGASPHIVDYLMKATPCHKGAYAGQADAVKILIENSGVDVDAQGPYNGYTALHDAVWHGHEKVVEVLLNGGVKRDLLGHNGKTPVELAKALGYSNIVNIFEKNINN